MDSVQDIHKERCSLRRFATMMWVCYMTVMVFKVQGNTFETIIRKYQPNYTLGFANCKLTTNQNLQLIDKIQFSFIQLPRHKQKRKK